MIRNRLKEIRMKEYMESISGFAEMLGVKLTTYSRWEAGDNAPTLEKAFDIASKLNKRVDDIWYK